MQRTFLRSTTATVVLALALVACGGDDEETSDTEATTVLEGTAGPATTTPGSDTTTAATDTTAAGADTTAAGTDAGGSDDFCEAAQPLADFNAETEPLDMTAEFEVMRDQAVAVINDGLGLYDDAIDAAPDEIRGQIETLREINVSLVESLEDASSMEDFEAAVADLGTPEVISATTDLNTYLTEECGFGLTSG